MRFGLKLWSSNTDLLSEALELIEPDLFQYIELTPIPETDIEPWLEHKIPFIIHATTERHGFNIGTRNAENKELLANSIQWANELNAKHIILHPGFGN